MCSGDFDYFAWYSFLSCFAAPPPPKDKRSLANSEHNTICVHICPLPSVLSAGRRSGCTILGRVIRHLREIGGASPGGGRRAPGRKSKEWLLPLTVCVSVCIVLPGRRLRTRSESGFSFASFHLQEQHKVLTHTPVTLGGLRDVEAIRKCRVIRNINDQKQLWVGFFLFSKKKAHYKMQYPCSTQYILECTCTMTAGSAGQF